MSFLKGLMSLLLVGTISGVAWADSHDQDHDHSHHHEHISDSSALTQIKLNDGKKWATDEPLRREMGKIREAIVKSTESFLNKSPKDKDYAKLSTQIRKSINTMFKECKLPADADANLHIILAEMLAGVSAMKGEVAEVSRAEGHLQVTRALDAYQKHFEDPKFQPVKL